MSPRKSLVFCLILALMALGFSLAIAPQLPEIVATHWNARGEVDGRGSKWFALFLMPAMMLFNVALYVALPRLSPKKFEISTFAGAYGTMWVVIQAMFLCLHLIFVQGARNEAIDITRWVMPVMFISFALMGNYMGKLRQNFYMGVRTPWTLADSRVWDATHRATGKIWFAGGIIGAFLSAIGLPWWIGLTGFFGIAFYPIYLSWAIYKKLVI